MIVTNNGPIAYTFRADFCRAASHRAAPLHLPPHARRLRQ